MIDYSKLAVDMSRLGMDQHASELHGLVSGYVCGGGGENVAVLLDWLGYDADGQGRDIIERLLEDARILLADPDFGFQPLLPEDKADLADRSQAVGRWAAGFISGLGASGGLGEDQLEGEVKEVLSDMHRISAMTDDVPDTEENEADLTEIVEYVRVSALLVFASCALSAGGVDPGDE